jgi:hypothetical protein
MAGQRKVSVGRISNPTYPNIYPLGEGLPSHSLCFGDYSGTAPGQVCVAPRSIAKRAAEPQGRLEVSDFQGDLLRPCGP